MAISDALAWRLNSGGTAADLYSDINNFLATNPTAQQTQAAMAQYGISPEDVAAATGGKSGGLLGGNILAGASWNSLNTALPEELTKATGQATTNVAVGGATTADTLNQLNSFLAGGGQFDPNATVYLQTGGVDFLQGVDKATIKDNINQIVKTLGAQGVDVVLTGSPYAASIQDVVTNNFDPKVDPLFNEIAKENNNVALVGVQGEILQNKKLLVDALHTNAEGTSIYNQAVIDALSQFKNQVPPSTPQAIADVQKTNTVATTPPVITQAVASPAVAQSLATQTVDSLIKAGNLNPTQIAASTGLSANEIISRVASTVPQGSSITLGDTRIVPSYEVIGSGEDQQIGALKNIFVEKTTGDINYRAPVGSTYQQLSADGSYERTGVNQRVPTFLEGLAPVLQVALLASGAGGALGSALGFSGAAGQALGTGLISAGGTALGGGNLEQSLKSGLLGGGLAYGGSQLSDLIQKSLPIDASNMTQAQFNDALEGNLVSNMQSAGLNKDQISAFLDDMGIGQGVTTAATTADLTTPSADTVNVTGVKAPTTLNNVLNTISTVPTVNVTSTKPQQVSQDVLDAVTAQLVSNQAATPTVNVTAQKPTTVNDVIAALATTGLVSNIPTVSVTANRPITSQTDLNNVISSLVTTGSFAPTTTVPTVTVTAPKTTNIGDTLAAITTIPSTLATTPVTSTPTTTTTKETDPLKVAQLALTAAGLLGAGSVLSNTGSTTGFDVVPVPEGWKTPPKTGVAPFTPLTPIDFGTRNLLIGTQWEKFLDPNYGKVPAPVQYSQPSNLSYNDLMGILGSKQGMPPASSLTINDIISGIQNQYGQANRSAMG